ncbi:MAG: helix-turn-helix transcriptional regulator [Spirochaetes bacterium]|nr:helix-turn-helix transcriptional regulator [Spirochaetota bacterium]
MRISESGFISTAAGRFGAHAHSDEHEFHFIVDGTGDFRNQKKRHPVTTRALVYSRPHEEHEFVRGGNCRKLSFYFIRFMPSAAEMKTMSLLQKCFMAGPLDGNDEMQAVFASLERKTNSANVHFKDSAAHQLMAFICELVGGGAVTPSAENRYVRDAVAYMRRTLNTTFDFPALVKELGITASYFDRLFKQHTGMPPRRYFLGLKMNTAKFLLRETDTPVYRIADDLSFSDEFHFSRMFKQFAGVPPKIYRDRFGRRGA